MKEELVDFMAKSCHYAQEHCGDPQAWPVKLQDREYLLQCVSYQMACFLAQNTVSGGGGVECDVILKELSSTEKNKYGFMIKSIGEWKKLLNKIAKELGGWKMD